MSDTTEYLQLVRDAAARGVNVQTWIAYLTYLNTGSGGGGATLQDVVDELVLIDSNIDITNTKLQLITGYLDNIYATCRQSELYLSKENAINTNSKSLDSTLVQIHNSVTYFVGGYFYNPNVAAVTVKFWDALETDVVLGVTPTNYKIVLQPGQYLMLSDPNIYNVFATALTVAATAGYLDSDTANVAIPLEFKIKRKP